ncbi:5-methyltetrahydropteroyltriglutamate--homocysteine methyltransferase [Haloarculaceae archaeon H-GB1-1]|nr:5-methyltetrahydropteroyltriglutamate--homocysteine methyltransferase [Haloarculaceae archaeon H-GB1-1]
MMHRLATTTGLYPLPDWAKDELSALKGHQKEDLVDGDERSEVTNAYLRARSEIVDVQREAGLDRIVEGQLRWDDMLAHPLTVHDAVETGGIVRYYDNNNFYRDPIVTGELVHDGDVAADLEAAQSDDCGPLQAVLPDPYTLADLATDDYYGDEREFLAAVASFLADEVAAFPDVETLFLLAPSLAVSPPTDDLGGVTDALETVASATDAEVVVHPYWDAPPGRVYQALLDADVDALGYDLVAAADASLTNAREYGTPETVSLGVVDGQNTLVETRETIDERVAAFESVADGVDTAYLTTNAETFYIPVNRFEAKLAALGAAARPPEVQA